MKSRKRKILPEQKELVSADIEMPRMRWLQRFSGSQFVCYAKEDGTSAAVCLFDFADGSLHELCRVPISSTDVLAVTADKTILAGNKQKIIIVPGESRSWQLPEPKVFSYPDGAALLNLISLGKSYVAGNFMDCDIDGGSSQNYQFFILNLENNEIQFNRGKILSVLSLNDDQFKLILRVHETLSYSYNLYSISINFREKQWLSGYELEKKDFYTYQIDCSPEKIKTNVNGIVQVFDVKRQDPRLLSDHPRYEYKLDSFDYFRQKTSSYSSDGSFYFVAPGGKLMQDDHGNVEQIATLPNVNKFYLTDDDRLVTMMKHDSYFMTSNDRYYYRIYKTRSYLYQELFSEMLLSFQFPENVSIAHTPISKIITEYMGSYIGLFSVKSPMIQDKDKLLVAAYLRRLRKLPYSQRDHLVVDILIGKIKDKKKTLQACLVELRDEIVKSDGKLNPSGAFGCIVQLISSSLSTQVLNVPSATI